MSLLCLPVGWGGVEWRWKEDAVAVPFESERLFGRRRSHGAGGKEQHQRNSGKIWQRSQLPKIRAHQLFYTFSQKIRVRSPNERRSDVLKKKNERRSDMIFRPTPPPGGWSQSWAACLHRIGVNTEVPEGKSSLKDGMHRKGGPFRSSRTHKLIGWTRISSFSATTLL